MKAFFLSDIHLRDPSESNSQTLLLFLSDLLEDRDVTHLFLVGDIFDLWIENHAYFIERYASIIDAIRNVVASGVEVHYFEGNHDLYLNKFWQQDVGARVHDGPYFFKLGRLNVRIEHGDQMNPDDTGYLMLRWFLRTRLMKFIARNLPSGWIRSIGEKASAVSRIHSSDDRAFREEDVRAMMRRYAGQAYAKSPFDLLISGHTHVQDIYEWSPSGGLTSKAINLGSWFAPPMALILENDQARFISLKCKK